MKIRLGTRGSRLAVVQSEAVAAALRARGAQVELVLIRMNPLDFASSKFCFAVE